MSESRTVAVTEQDRKHWQRRLRALTPHSGQWLRATVLLSWLAGSLLIAQAWLLARIVNGVVFDAQDLASQQGSLWALLGVFVLRAVLIWAAEQAAFEAAAQVKRSVRSDLLAAVHALGPARLPQSHAGLVTTLVDGVEALDAYYARYLPTMSLVVWLPLSLLVFVYASDGLSALILVLTAPLIPLFMMLVGRGAERRNQQQWASLNRLGTHLLDVIQGLTTLRLFNASRREARVVASLAEQYRQRSMSVLRIAFLSSFVLEFFATVSIAIVAVMIGFRLYFGEMDFQYGFFVLLLAPEFYLPLRNLGTHYHARMQAIAAIEQIEALRDTSLMPGAQGFGETFHAVDLAHHGETSTPLLRLRGLQQCYPDGRQGLAGVDLDFHRGELLAVVGESGAGKSSLMHALLGFLPLQQGRIEVDSRLQVNSLATWHEHCLWLPQQPWIAAATLADNLRLADPHASDAQMMSVLARCGLADWLSALPQGLSTRIGEGGQAMSGGQAHALAMARALLKPAALWLLDEPSAHLDVTREAAMIALLGELKSERCIVVIAHRLDLLRAADRIALMVGGRVHAVGTHAELLQCSPDYVELLRAAEWQA
ncbi:MAG: thiol reductant ABC exporter subunit CydD [Lysobacteraceae bacterium]